MIPPRSKTRRAVPLRGSLKWVLVLLIPFSTLFFETWLTVQTRLNDYEVAEINRRIREAQEAINQLKAEAAQVGTMLELEAKAPDLDLVKPNPSQIQVMYFCADQEGKPAAHTPRYEMATAVPLPSKLAGGPPSGSRMIAPPR